MAEPHDNNLPHDSKEVRLYRLMRMQNNIDTYSAVLGILGAILAWAQSCYTRFTDAVTAATVEDGESQDARIILRDKFDVALDYYQKAKEILQAKLDLYPPDNHLLASYGIKISTPRTYQALKEAADAMIFTHDKLDAAGDERVIAQAIIDQLTIYRDEFNEALEAAGIEDRETDDAYALQHKYFDEDTERLRLIYKIACLIWGDDDPKLKDLGFVPSSEIWTPGDPEPGAPESWEDEVANLLVVEGVGNAASIRGDVNPDADGVAIFLAEGPMGDDTVPVRPVDPIEPQVPSLPFDMSVAFNVRVWLWVCHVKDGSWGAITGPVWIEIVK